MWRLSTVFLLLLWCSAPAHAIITAGGDGRLPVPPTREYVGSGSQFIGKWGSFTGTVIGKHHFITAVHVGGGVGQAFIFDDQEYIAEACTTIPGSDIAVWRVAEEFPRFAPLYASDNEVGKEIVIFGRGCRRGRPYRVADMVLGWYWGANDGSLSWGTNVVAATASMPTNSHVLVWTFDLGGGEKEGTVAGGDSGGGVFIKDDTTWKLAGINFASGGQYSKNKTGDPNFMAALFDARGLYQQTGDTWTMIDQRAWEPAPTLAFASRISPHINEIRRILSGRDKAEERHPLSRKGAIFIGGGIVLLVIFLTVALRRQKNRRARNRFQ